MIAVAGAVVLSLGSACSTRVKATPRKEYLPPFHASSAAPDELHVRADVAERIATAPVGSSGAQASLVGYGRTSFASDASYSVRVPFPSFVEKVLVGLGDTVRKGDVLAELRSSEVARLRAEQNEAAVLLEAERRTLRRLEQLISDGTATLRERNESEARLAGAKQRLAGLRAQLSAVAVDASHGDKFVLRAHASGKVLQRSIDPGELVGPGSDEPALVIGDPSQLVVRASFLEREGVWLRQDLPCTVKLNALGGIALQGVLTRVGRAADRQTRSLDAICDPSSVPSGLSLSSGMTARVEVAVSGETQLLAPRAAVLLKRDTYVVFVKKSARVLERRDVSLGQPFSDQIQILSGLAPGEEVVVSGAVLLDGELDRLL